MPRKALKKAGRREGGKYAEDDDKVQGRTAQVLAVLLIKNGGVLHCAIVNGRNRALQVYLTEVGDDNHE